MKLPLPTCVGQIAWECRLGGPELTIDLQAGLAESPAARRDLAAYLSQAASPPGWEPAHGLLADWLLERTLPGIPAVFLELDEVPPGTQLRPLLFPRIRHHTDAQWVLTAMAVLGSLSEGCVPVGVYRWLARVTSALPAGATPLYVSWLGARGWPVARWIASIPRDGLAGWLQVIGWEGEAEQVQSTLAELCPWSSHVPVGVDLQEGGVGPRLGVELFWASDPGGDSRMETALELLGRWAGVDPERCEAARGWLRGIGVDPVLEPRLQLKVSFEGGTRRAKAYLGCWNIR